VSKGDLDLRCARAGTSASGSAKDEPQVLARNFKPRPWKIEVEGEVAKPATYDIDDFIKPLALEERV
jgi:sulfoxide reductase catalytic subunit YedY